MLTLLVTYMEATHNKDHLEDRLPFILGCALLETILFSTLLYLGAKLWEYRF